MADLITESIECLRVAGVRLTRGLSADELAAVQQKFDFRFGPEHQRFLQSALPSGGSWPDWRDGPEADLRRRLGGPVDGVLLDVCHGDFWPTSWGDRPDQDDERERKARAHLAYVPKLVPVFSHRFLTSDPHFEPSPVFSVHQSDVIFYGDNVWDYFSHEFRVDPRRPSQRVHVPFWSDLAENQDM